MFNVSIDIDIPTDKIVGSVNTEKKWLAIGQQADKEMFPFVPAKEEVLAGDTVVTATSGSAEVEYLQPCAHKMHENNYNFRKDPHPQATNHWDEHSIGEGGQVRDRFIRNVETILTEDL